MLNKIKKYIRVEVLIAIASAVFGILIGPVLEAVTAPLFDTPTRALLSAIAALALLVVIAIIAIGVFARKQDDASVETLDELSTIRSRLGLTVNFVHSPPNRSTGEVYRLSRGILERAEREILHLYYFRLPGATEPTPKHTIETDAYRAERERYTLALFNVVQRHKDEEFFYRRIYQFPEGLDAKFTEDRVGTRWYAHTKTMLEMLTAYPDAAVIKKSPLFLQQNFYIVDERYVIWGIDAIDPEYNVPYYEGTLFFDDPHKEFVGYLKSFFLRIDAHATIIDKLPEG